MIKFNNVFMRYPNGVTALNGLKLDIEEGEFVFIVGPSGAGKSTLIKLLLKELNPTKGKVVLEGEDITRIHARSIPRIRSKTGVVFQDFRLLENKTAYENIAFALEIRNAKTKDIKPLVLRIMDLVGLKGKEKSRPNELSGGEQQRVSIARAIINDPPILIADEPTGNLDPETSWEIMKLLKNINRAGTTIIMVTHDKNIVNDMKQRVIAIENGKIVRDEKNGVYGYDN